MSAPTSGAVLAAPYGARSNRLAREYRDRAARDAALAADLAAALLDTTLPTDLADTVRRDMAAAARRRDRYRDAADLLDYRAGVAVAAWPARAPWAGL